MTAVLSGERDFSLELDFCPCRPIADEVGREIFGHFDELFEGRRFDMQSGDVGVENVVAMFRFVVANEDGEARRRPT